MSGRERRSRLIDIIRLRGFAGSERCRTRGSETPGTVDWETVQTGRRSAPRREKRHCRGVRGACGNGPEPPEMPALATYEQSVSPENVAKVSLTGLSFQVSMSAAASRLRNPFRQHHRTSRRRTRWVRVARSAAESGRTA